MADAKKCDRCGSFYDRGARSDSDFLLSKYCNSGRHDLTRVIDLCPTCSSLLNLWMEGKAEIIGNEGYRPVCGPYEEN
jgi:hypothetical protein